MSPYLYHLLNINFLHHLLNTFILNDHIKQNILYTYKNSWYA